MSQLSNLDFSVKSEIEDLISESLSTPDTTRFLRSGSQMLYKGIPIKFLGVNELGEYKIAYLDRNSGEWIPKSVTHQEYSRLRNVKHKIFKYNFSNRLTNLI